MLLHIHAIISVSKRELLSAVWALSLGCELPWDPLSGGWYGTVGNSYAFMYELYSLCVSFVPRRMDSSISSVWFMTLWMNILFKIVLRLQTFNNTHQVYIMHIGSKQNIIKCSLIHFSKNKWYLIISILSIFCIFSSTFCSNIPQIWLFLFGIFWK